MSAREHSGAPGTAGRATRQTIGRTPIGSEPQVRTSVCGVRDLQTRQQLHPGTPGASVPVRGRALEQGRRSARSRTIDAPTWPCGRFERAQSAVADAEYNVCLHSCVTSTRGRRDLLSRPGDECTAGSVGRAACVARAGPYEPCSSGGPGRGAANLHAAWSSRHERSVQRDVYLSSHRAPAQSSQRPLLRTGKWPLDAIASGRAGRRMGRAQPIRWLGGVLFRRMR